MNAAGSRCTRPARGDPRGARTALGRRCGAGALRDPLDLGRPRRLADRRGDRGGQPGHVHGRRGLAVCAARRPPARGGRLRRLRPGDDRALVGARPDLRARRGARARRSSSPTRSSRSSIRASRSPSPLPASPGCERRSSAARPESATSSSGSSRSPVTTCSSRTTPASTSASSSSSSSCGTGGDSPSPRSALRRSRVGCSKDASAASRPRLARELLRSRDRALPPGAARRGGDRPRSSST